MKLKTIQMKITVTAGACLLLTAAVIIGFSGFIMRAAATKTHEDAVKAAQEKAGDVSARFASQVRGALDEAMNAGRTMAQTLSGIKDKKNKVALDRDEANAILRILLARNPAFLGTYTCWEPNEFDGLDEVYAESEGNDKTGRFIPYWSRDADGNIAMEPLVDYEVEGAGDYYLLPRKTKTEQLLEPYIYPVQGKDVLITSLVTPIVVEDRFYGIAGVDLALDFIQRLADEAASDLYDGEAQVILISNQGLLAGVSGRPELVGKHMKEIHEDWEEDITYIQQGLMKVEEDEGRIAAWAPLKIGRTTTPWCVNLLLSYEKVTEGAEEMKRTSINRMWWMVGIGLVLTVVALLLMGVLARSIARPINRTIEGLDSSAGQVGSAARQVSSASQSLADGASQQAASIEETSSSLEEMSSMTKMNAQNANQAKEMMNRAAGIVSDVNRKMDEMAGAIEEITRSSEETGKIIKTIDEIAFQTNLLALNAAVEAARAGEAGAGFAVVADEVRNLAMRAADAAKNTAELIESTIKAVRNGSELTTATQGGFKENVEISTKVNDLIDEIASASGEQAQGIDQVNRAVSEMDKVIQQVAANAEESASASEEMTAQAEEMTALVNDLVAIVGGAASDRAESAVRSPARRPEKKAPVKPKQEKALTTPPPPEKEVKPEDVIPMDDDDFKEF